MNYIAWFIGFSPDLVIGVYVGHDQPKSLGYKQTGSSVAAPIFKSFVKEAKIIENYSPENHIAKGQNSTLSRALRLIKEDKNRKGRGSCGFGNICRRRPGSA